MSEQSTAYQQWVRKRADAVRKRYTAFQCMHEHGHGDQLVDEDTAVQVFCPFHPNTATAAARYYPSEGGRSDHVHCFGACHGSWDSVNLFLKFKNISFMEALRELERRFGIRIEQKPDGIEIEEPKDRSSAKFVSDAWADVPRVLVMLESKLTRLRETAPMRDYIRFCRVLDSVQYDLDRNKGQQTAAMVDILGKLREAMDKCVTSISLDMS